MDAREQRPAGATANGSRGPDDSTSDPVRSRAMTCTSCGTANPADNRFCGGCGMRLAVGCAACGAALGPDQRFCGQCGAPVAAPETVPQAVPPLTPVAERRLVSVL